MNVLVACEETQEVCKAFRAKGHNAFSCDLQECSGGHPEWHVLRDAILMIKSHVIFRTQDKKWHVVNRWDMIIAHPPCTYLTAAGACRMYPKRGQIDPERLEKAMVARDFFMDIYNADCPKICIENPRPLKIIDLPKETQQIQPYQFGEPWSKLTYLWIKGLPKLQETEYCYDYKPYVSCGTSRNKGNPDKAGASRAGGASKIRSKTFPGIAKAMAEQWG